MIWGNTHKTFFKNLSQWSLAGKAPILGPVSGSGTADTEPSADPEAGWLEVAVAREEVACCRLQWPFPRCAPSSPWLFIDRVWVVRQSKPLGKCISFKIKARRSCVRGMFRQHTRPGLERITAGPEAPPASGSGLRPGLARTTNPVSPRRM